MNSVEFKDLPLPLIQHILQTPEEPIEVRMHDQRLGMLTFDPNADDPPIDLSRSPRLQQILDESREDYRKHGGISLQEIKARLAREDEARTATRSDSAGE